MEIVGLLIFLLVSIIRHHHWDSHSTSWCAFYIFSPQHCIIYYPVFCFFSPHHCKIYYPYLLFLCVFEYYTFLLAEFVDVYKISLLLLHSYVHSTSPLIFSLSPYFFWGAQKYMLSSISESSNEKPISSKVDKVVNKPGLKNRPKLVFHPKIGEENDSGPPFISKDAIAAKLLPYK